MNKLEIVESPIIEPSKNKLWFKKGALKYFGANGWQNISTETKYATAHLTQSDVDVDIEIPIASDIQLGGVRIMDKEATHLLVSKEGNLYVFSTDNYLDDNPNAIPTIAAIQGLLMDVVGEKYYATTENYGIVKQAENVSGSSQPTTLDEGFELATLDWYLKVTMASTYIEVIKFSSVE